MLEYKIGSTYVFFIKPQWIYGGTVVAVDDEYITLNDVVFLETPGRYRTILGDVPLATTPEELHAACDYSWPMADGTSFKRDDITISATCKTSLEPLKNKPRKSVK